MRWSSPLLLVTICLTALSAHPDAARAGAVEAGGQEPREALPKYLKGIGIDEHLGGALPLDTAFYDEQGERVRLGDYFDGKLPVIVTLNYSNCPMLCSRELTGLVEGLRKVDLDLGSSFRAVTVSLDPKETPAIANRTKRRYVGQYARPSAGQGWHFLTGKNDAIHDVARAIGFEYRYDAEHDQYYHAAAIAVATPDGRVARYLYGIEFQPQTLRLALVEASEGKIGTTIDKLILFCCAYDPKEGSYALVANRVMTLGGVLTLGVLGVFLLVLWRNESKKKSMR